MMQGETPNKWRKLCEQAAVEQDPQRLIELIHEINSMLEYRRSSGS
jgi:hypothetical protein